MTWDIALRQLGFRWRQHLLAVLGTALVFATALLASGMSSGFHAEVRRTVEGIGGDGWVMASGTASPFSGEVPLDQGVAGLLSTEPGVRRADPILILNESIAVRGDFHDALVIGHPFGGAEPPVVDGRAELRPGEAVVDRSTGISLGAAVTIAGRPLQVVGRTAGRTVLAGTSTVYLPLVDAQQAGAAGARLISAVVVTGVPGRLPSGLQYLDRRAVAGALLRPLRASQTAIAASRFLLWTVAAVIVACVTYMTAIEQLRDFAVLKAVGASSRSLAAGLAAQAVLVTLLGAVLALALARLLRPGLGSFPVAFTVSAQALLPVVAVVVGVVASLSGIRRALRTDPALAFAGAG